MAEQIIDGTGSGYKSKVDSNNRLHVRAVSSTELSNAALQGEAYNVSTGAITLTSANESAVGYFKYNGTDPVVIKEILVIINPSTGGSGVGTIKIKKNPTGGTIISNAVPIPTASNRDFSSAKTLDGLIYKGVEGDTITGETEDFAVSTRDAAFSGVLAFDAATIVLRKGNTLAITFEPATGNTSQTIVVAGTIYVDTATVNGGV